MTRRYRLFSEEERKWIRDNAYGNTLKELTEEFNSMFPRISEKHMSDYLGSSKIRLGNRNEYTDEMKEFIISYYCDEQHTQKETVDEFNRRFDLNMTLTRMNGFISNHKLKNGMHAKRRTETMFRKGATPHNAFPEGKVFVQSNGYEYIKKNGTVSRIDHLVWEKEKGPIPKGYAIIHLDGDRLNNRIDNLVLLDKKEIGKMSHNKLDYDAETNSMIVARVKLESAIERKGK